VVGMFGTVRVNVCDDVLIAYSVCFDWRMESTHMCGYIRYWYKYRATTTVCM
jgi:hypothetical protein